MIVRLLTVLWFAFWATAAAAEPPHSTFSPHPPGTIVQSRLVYLAGEGMHSQWRAILSKKLLGTGNGMSFYQWFLSFYALDGTVYRLKYRSPDAPVPFGHVTKSRNESVWFPVQDAKIVGTGATLSVKNPCDLSASIVHGAHGDSLQLAGPYYAANAALCCPTKERVTATLRFNNGTWTEQPRYFEILK